MPMTRGGDSLEKASDCFKSIKHRFLEKPSAKYSVGWLKTMKRDIEEKWATFETELHDTCVSMVETQDQEKRKAYQAHFSKEQTAYYDIMGSIIDNLDRLESTSANGTNSSTSVITNPTFRLPAVSIAKFSGDYSKWRSFRDLFNSIIIQNPSLSSVEKLYYLTSYCEGRPKEIVMKYPLESSSFDSAWKALSLEYENPRILINTQIKNLFACPIVKSESASSLRQLQNTFNDCINSLKNLNVNTDHWDPILVFMATQRLPTLSHTLWESSLDSIAELPSWDKLNTFLTQRFRTLEAIDTKRLDLAHSLQRPNQSDRHTTNFKSNHSSVANFCPICSKSPHTLTHCDVFKSWTPPSRYDYIKQHKLCINCFGSHKFQECTSKGVCRQCSRRHHTLLHFQSTTPHVPQTTCASTKTVHTSNKTGPQTTFQPDQPNSSVIDTSANLSPILNTTAYFSRRNNKVLLATALVHVIHQGKPYTARALIDQGSESSFITQSFAQFLKLKRTPCSAAISGIGNSGVINASSYTSITIQSRYSVSSSLQVRAIILKNLVHTLPSHCIPDNVRSQFNCLQLADPYYFRPDVVDILLGADVYSQVIRSGFYSNSGFTGQETIFGYILSGSWNDPRPTSAISGSIACNVALEKAIHQFWEIEEPPIAHDQTADEKYCEEHFKSTHSRRSDGRFVVELPFIQEYPDSKFLASSRSIALSRLQSLKRSFSRNPKLKPAYDAIIAEYGNLNHLSVTTSNEIYQSNTSKEQICNSYYLPHHGVTKNDSLTTKLRVVFDASCKTDNGISLNDVLHVGPPLQSTIIDVLNNIRSFPLLFNCDIKMMYRQIRVADKHTDLQRILYFDDNDTPMDFKLLTVTFGVSSSPYLAMRCLRQLAITGQEKFPLASAILLSSTYVDDIFGGFFDRKTALIAKEQLITLLSSAGFELHKWVSNNSDILKSIPAELQSTGMLDNSSALLKTLGILYDQQTDNFSFANPELQLNPPITKRKVFSNISKIFDPAGWLSPVFVTAKILIQSIWADGTGWDETIRTERISTWEHFITSLNDLSKIVIPRWFRYEPSAVLEVHGFCDASIKAYAACVYLRVIFSESQIFTHLILSKTKVAPLKTESLPRLELCGAVLLSKLMQYVETSWKHPISRFYAWCDSTIVLAWLSKPSHLWKTFVANRVTKIHRNCASAHWSHIGSKQNPADLASRGVPPQELLTDRKWFYGPDFLQILKVPETNDTQTETNLERRAIKIFHSIVEENIDTMLSKFSSFTRTIRVWTYVFRFINGQKERVNYESHQISFDEFEMTKMRIISLVQKLHYAEEILAFTNNKAISLKSTLVSLNPMLDNFNVLRVNGRLSNLTIPNITNFPIIIPQQSHLALLIARYFHIQYLHASQRLMESLIRRSYWITRLPQLVKRTIHLCKVCYVEKRKTMSQIMAPLPLDRITPNQVFVNVGLDFGGPITLKLYEGRCNKTSKGYICLFVCFVTKSIHLEAVSSLSTQAFLDALERFISRRGLCQKIYCDNGTNFVGAKNVLDREFRKTIKNATNEAAQMYAARKVNFIFNCPAAPHMAGLAEAGIKSVKFHLKRSFSNVKLCFEQFSTVLCRIEACLNSRPLCALNNDPLDLDPLTPGHFLRGSALLAPPEPSLVTDETSKPFKVLRNIEQLKVIFWNRWKNEYLHTLQQRRKWQIATNDIHINDLVVLLDKNTAPQAWVTGRILQIFPGKDGHVRVVEVKTKHGIYKRPISSLVLLPNTNQ